MEKRELLTIIVSAVVAFQLVWIVAGFFVRNYFVRLKEDIKILFDKHNELNKDVNKLSENVARIEGRINSK